jgi:hypothetical protein
LPGIAVRRTASRPFAYARIKSEHDNLLLPRSVNIHNSIAISSHISHGFCQSRPAQLKS